MTTPTINQSKAWLSPDGAPIWVETHIQGASDILRRTFSGCGIEAYQIMFRAGYIRIQIDGYDLFFNFDGNQPNQLQLKWLRDTAMSRHLILINGDTRKEVDLENEEYFKVDGDDLGERYMKNEGNADFMRV